MIPQDFESWKYCIEHECGIALTLPFAQGRLAIYEDVSHAETKRFVDRYGEEHYLRVKNWFARVLTELAAAEKAV